MNDVWVASKENGSYEAPTRLGIFATMERAKAECLAHAVTPIGRAIGHGLRHDAASISIAWDYEAFDYDDSDKYGRTWTSGEVRGDRYIVSQEEVRT